MWLSDISTEDTKVDFLICFRNWQEQCVFEVRGSILREINGSVSFTIINCLFTLFLDHTSLCSGSLVQEFNLFCRFGKAILVFVWERWPLSCLPPHVEFINKNKILPNAFVCEPNCSPRKVLLPQGAIVIWRSIILDSKDPSETETWLKLQAH